MPLDLIDNKSTLVQVMAWCHQATSHYLIQCSPRSLLPYGVTRAQWVDSLAPGRSQFNFRQIIFKLILVNGGWGICYEIALRWMPLDLTDDKSTSVQVMAWCRQATSHYLNQCWPRSPTPYGVTRPQWSQQKITKFFKYIFKYIFCNKIYQFRIQFDLSLFIRVQLTMIQHRLTHMSDMLMYFVMFIEKIDVFCNVWEKEPYS